MTFLAGSKGQNITLKTCRKQWTIGRGGEIGYAYLCWWCDIMMIYIYIYIYIYVCVCVCVCVSVCVCVYLGSISLLIHMWVIIKDIFCGTYFFFVNPFESPYLSYDILQELAIKPSIISYFQVLFYCNQIQYNYRLDETILKHWFKETYSPLILIFKKIIMYYNKFKTFNLVINNNSSPSIGVL